MPKLITDKQKINSFIENKYKSTFENITDPKNIDLWLKQIPQIQYNHNASPNFSINNIINTLTKRQNTASGPDMIQFDMFKFLNNHNSCIFEILNKLFLNIYNLNYIPKTWTSGITTLILKPDSNIINNWRPITLLNTMYKGFTLILNEYLQYTLTENNIIPEEQCGFNKNQDTSIAISSYIKTIKHSISN